MPWTYEQMTGDFYKDGKFFGTGYSGNGKTYKDGRNNPDIEGIEGVGPCPRGTYKIGKARYSRNVGPITMDLKPINGTDTIGQSALMIHGDNKASDVSKGCIVLALSLRRLIDRSADRELRVVRGG